MKEDTEQSPEEFAHKKSLGQNFLTSNIVPDWLCAAAHLKPRETVLEIGPGTGALTRELLKNGYKVIAIETDERAVDILQSEFANNLQNGQLTLHHTDARELDLANYGLKAQKFAVVANIPYYLSGFLLRSILESDIQPHTLVFLMQKELVERIARSQKESLLSLSVKAFGEPRYVKTVTRGHFHPMPKVDSAILAVNNISNERLNGLSKKHFFTLLHLGFGNKRKQLLGNLAQVYEREDLTKIFAELAIDHTIRAEDLTLSTWVKLAEKIPQI